ncbi:probable disease resistance protein At4g27220 [Durio zibethinus]|uniref:Probable disease resistance protein At4g27220 n=1 Tax=Durio zibethinus TaxID=66656 RepID=A0A6P6A9Q4_DURZI|nr:probable disease resistance protein At4g27220 [Durio zibethinus]
MAVVIDIVSSIVAKAKEYVIDPIKNQMNCISNHENNVKSLVHKVVSLEEARERVLHAVDAATRKGEKIEHDVQRWLTTVDKIIAEDVRKVMEYEEKAKKKCFVGLCPNLGARSKLSMEAEKVAKAVSKLLSQRNFDRVSYRVAPHGIIAASFEGFKAFGSRTLILNGIMEALQDDSIKIVGVYGMAGVGKTTLVKEVAQLVMERNLIDSVLMAFVTVTPDVKEIQTQIADLLGLKFEEQSMVVRALQLRERLSKERKILVVLDDIWARLDLKEVGIPFGNEHEGCKIILTSRSLDVLSSGMGTQKNFAVHVLNEEEAWDMFKETAGDDVQSRDLLPIAIKVAKECAGLPLAITTVATTLKNKSLFVWKNALLQMKNLSFRSIGAGNLYSAIELSYNCLESEEVKAIFLLCGFIGHHGLIEDLLKYAFGLGCLRFVRTVEEARDSVLTAVTVLKASCLLLDSNDNERFDIHNIVLGFAMSIASRDYNVLVRDGVVLEQGYMEMENRSWINLRYPRVREFPDEVKCPHLSLFCMATDNSVKIPATFFEQTKRLKILDLTGMHFSYLPGSIYPLKNLHTLRLHQCALKDITIIGGLKNLKVLSLAQSDINALPWEIAQLTRLNLLDLSNCTKLEIIPPNVLLKLSMLEELYMDNSFVQWEDEALGSKRRNASLGELNYLSHLTTLYAHIPNAQIIPERLFIETLKRYRIFIGGDAWDWSSEFEYSRTLKFRLYTSTKPLFNEQIVFPSLEDLHLSRLNIERIWPIQLATTSYFAPSLRTLIVDGCGNLKYLLSLSVARCLVQLRRLEIIDCRSMVQVVETEEKLYEIAYMISFPCLTTMKIKDLPELTGFYSGNDNIVFPSLEEVTVECCPNMKIFCNGVLETPKLRNVQISEREHIGCRVGDLNTAIRQFDIEKLKKRDKAEGEGELMVEVGISGKQGEEAVQQEAMLKEKKIEILLSSPIDMSSRAIKYEKDQRAVPEKAEEINEAEVISERDPEFGKIQRLPDDVEVNRERTSTPVEKPLSATGEVNACSLVAMTIYNIFFAKSFLTRAKSNQALFLLKQNMYHLWQQKIWRLFPMKMKGHSLAMK